MNIVDTNSWNNILDYMVIIGGSGRSGTTIMGKLINSLNNVEYLFEPSLLAPLLLKKGELKEQSLKELVQFHFFDGFLLDALAGRNINLNRNDDSCILHVKTEEEIKQRHERSLSRIELETLVNNSTFSFKLPEVVFFLNTLDILFPYNRKLLMHRNPNDVINSVVRKGWFSDEYLNLKHPSQIFAVDIKNDIKIPYWIKNEDKNFWCQASEINRCAYYYKRISEEIVSNAEKSIIVNYDEFIENPNDIFNKIVEALDLTYGEKTEEILDTVKFQVKNRVSFINDVDLELLDSINSLENKIIKCSIK